MDITTIIVFTVAIIAFILIGIFSRAATLDKLKMLDGEKILFEEENTKYDHTIRKFPRLYLKAKIVLTNKRIILAQKLLFRKKYAMRHVINYIEKGPPLKPSDFFTMRRWYWTFYTTKNRVSFKKENNKQIVRITIPFPNRGLFYSEPTFNIYTNHIEAYRKILSF